MNCRSFQDQLPEYVEGTLAANALADVKQHLAGCDACRRAVEKEKRLARALSNHLRQSSDSLTLRPEIRRKILAASQQKTASMTESITSLWNYWFRLAAVPVSLLLIAGILAVIHFYRPQHQEVTQTPVTIPVKVATSSPGQSPQPAASLQISYHLPTYTFGQQGDMIVDALSSETVTAHGIFQPSGRQSSSPNLDLKTPL